MRHPSGRHLATPLLLLASAILLTVIHPPHGGSAWAWIALVPFILASHPKTPTRHLVIWCLLIFAGYWLLNLRWLSPITVAGWIAFCLYSAPLAVLTALCLRWCRQQSLPMSLCVAVLWVGAEQCQGLFLGGFYWRFLGHSQFQNLPLIQIADLTGAGGVSFVLALANGLITDIWLAFRKQRLRRFSLLLNASAVMTVIVGVLSYGLWRLNQSHIYETPGPKVAAIQSNVPQSVKDTFSASEDILSNLLADSNDCAASQPDLIVWPETMVQCIVDLDVWPYLQNQEYVTQCRTTDLRLRKHVSEHTIHLLTGAYGATIGEDTEGVLYLRNHNSAVLYRPEGLRDPDRYDKIHLVLFGEYLPFKRTWPWLHQLLLGWTPYEYDYSLDAGNLQTLFSLPHRNLTTPTDTNTAIETAQDPYQFGVIICFEDTIPRLARSYALDEQGRKQVDWLVNISNDGWFVGFDDTTGDVQATAELIQHVAICTFRAVENRLGILRSVNTGISCLIAPSGRIHWGFNHASPGFPEDPLARQGIAGWFADTMPIDTRVTWFTRLGPWLDRVCAWIFGLLSLGIVLQGLLSRRRFRRLWRLR
ncbi:apolipoprotein N-acyltransferase [Planctomycetota bacterium]